MEVLNRVEPVYLTDSTQELLKYEAVAIVAPGTHFRKAILIS